MMWIPNCKCNEIAERLIKMQISNDFLFLLVCNGRAFAWDDLGLFPRRLLLGSTWSMTWYRWFHIDSVGRAYSMVDQIARSTFAAVFQGGNCWCSFPLCLAACFPELNPAAAVDAADALWLCMFAGFQYYFLCFGFQLFRLHHLKQSPPITGLSKHLLHLLTWFLLVAAIFTGWYLLLLIPDISRPCCRSVGILCPFINRRRMWSLRQAFLLGRGCFWIVSLHVSTRRASGIFFWLAFAENCEFSVNYAVGVNGQNWRWLWCILDG